LECFLDHDTGINHFTPGWLTPAERKNLANEAVCPADRFLHIQQMPANRHIPGGVKEREVDIE